MAEPSADAGATSMRVVHTRAEAREWSRAAHADGRRTAFVPTMGALHAGHVSLIERARAVADVVALSIFVNPLQFGPTEDFARYPRSLARDLELAAAASVDMVFAPAVAEMYPHGQPAVVVVPDRGADVLCGRSRPGHFRGVLTVVAKLFGSVLPDVAVFGQKDYQQLALIRRMVADLDFPIEIVVGRTVRDPDGLALSSRNRYLSGEDRERALELSRALRDCAALFEQGETDANVYRQRMRRAEGNGVSVEYAEVVDPLTLATIGSVTAGSVCAIAARVGSTRLIDNLILGESLDL